jgi:hypothetical protein
VVNRIVDSADEGDALIDHHQLAVHPAEHVEPPLHHAAHRVVAAQLDAGLQQRTEQLGAKVGRAPAVDEHVHLGTVARGLQQGLLQAAADLVVVPDEGLEQHLALRVRDHVEHARVVALAVLEQGQVVAVGPVGHGLLRE